MGQHRIEQAYLEIVSQAVQDLAPEAILNVSDVAGAAGIAPSITVPTATSASQPVVLGKSLETNVSYTYPYVPNTRSGTGIRTPSGGPFKATAITVRAIYPIAGCKVRGFLYTLDRSIGAAIGYESTPYPLNWVASTTEVVLGETDIGLIDLTFSSPVLLEPDTDYFVGYITNQAYVYMAYAFGTSPNTRSYWRYDPVLGWVTETVTTPGDRWGSINVAGSGTTFGGGEPATWDTASFSYNSFPGMVCSLKGEVAAGPVTTSFGSVLFGPKQDLNVRSDTPALPVVGEPPFALRPAANDEFYDYWEIAAGRIGIFVDVPTPITVDRLTMYIATATVPSQQVRAFIYQYNLRLAVGPVVVLNSARAAYLAELPLPEITLAPGRYFVGIHTDATLRVGLRWYFDLPLAQRLFYVTDDLFPNTPVNYGSLGTVADWEARAVFFLQPREAIGSVTLSTEYVVFALTALGLTTYGPVLGNPELNPPYHLFAVNLTTASPQLGTPILSVPGNTILVLTALGVTTGRPELGRPAPLVIDSATICGYLPFVPVWQNEQEYLGAVTEGQSVAIPLAAENIYEGWLAANQSVLTVGPLSGFITAFALNDVPTPFTVNGYDIVFQPLLTSAYVRIETGSFCTFSLLNGTLPAGLTLDSRGLIYGTVANLLTATDYEFTVRVSNVCKLRDHTFVLRAEPVSYNAFFGTELTGQLSADSTLGILFYDLGSYALGESVNFTVSVLDPDGLIPPLSIRPVPGLPQTGTYLNELPPGLSLGENLISGVIGASAEATDYYFAVQVDQDVPVALNFRLTVRQAVNSEVSIVADVVWMTPAGQLGTIEQGESSFLSVYARVTSGSPATYALANGSGPLPPGLTLNPSSGGLDGTLSYTGAPGNYSFTVRASTGGAFADRTFTVTVKTGLNTANVLDMYLKFRVLDEMDVVTPYASLIPQASIYRPFDPLFGRVASPRIYVVKGLDGNTDLSIALSGNGMPAVTNNDYHGTVRLLLGQHRWAVARDSNGTILYEVIYRDLLDPGRNAGGFAKGSTVIEQKVIYPQITTDAIYPVTLRNIRYDLVKDIGFATSDPSLKRVMGVDGAEAMPRWMRCEQVQGDPTSVLGYTAAAVVAYVLPGTAQALAAQFNANPRYFVPSGRVYKFDKYYFLNGTANGHAQLPQ